MKSENKNVLIIPDLKNSLQYENLFQFLKIKKLYLDSTNTQLDLESFDLLFFNNIFFKNNDNVDLPFLIHWNFKSNLNSQILISYLNGDPFLIKIKKFNKNFYFLTSSLSENITNLYQHAHLFPLC